MLNSKNPYENQVSYDQHVWLPNANNNYRTFEHIDKDREIIGDLIKQYFPENKVTIDKSDNIFSSYIKSKLSQEDLEKGYKKCRELNIPISDAAVARVGSFYFPDIQEKFPTIIKNPGDDVHRMQKSDYYIGDIYSANLILSSLQKKSIEIQDDGKYLDFGCSSGSLLRIMKILHKNAQFYGVDPIESAINWARENIDGVNFSLSQLRPPLEFEDETFDGISAVSIWSHFGEQEALIWFDEMLRCLKDNAWLAFTTHGSVSLSYLNSKKPYRKSEPRMLALFEGLVNSDFVFEEIYIDESPEGIDATGYGNTFFTRQWLLKNISSQWQLVYHGLGVNQGNQDLYILEKKNLS